MAKVNTGISVEEDVLDRTDAILDAIREQDEFGRRMDRSKLIENLLKDWNEENAHYLNGGDTGNRMLAAPAAD